MVDKGWASFLESLLSTRSRYATNHEFNEGAPDEAILLGDHENGESKVYLLGVVVEGVTGSKGTNEQRFEGLDRLGEYTSKSVANDGTDRRVDRSRSFACH